MLNLTVKYGLMVYSGFVLSRLWEWFAEPMGAPGISVLHATGIVLIAYLLRGGEIGYADLYAAEKKAAEDKKAYKVCFWMVVFINLFLSPTLALALGFIVHILRAHFG